MDEVTIEGLAAGGRGVGRVRGRVWLVEGAVPGDRVRAAPVRERPRLVEATATAIVERSQLRRDPPCRFQPRCGGCPWMVLGEDTQRTWKRRIVRDALDRIAGWPSVPVDEVVPSPSPLAYRNKVEFSFGRDAGGRRVLGLVGRGRPAPIVDVDRCLLQGPAEAVVLDRARAFFLEGPGRDDPWPDAGPDARRLVVRTSTATGGILVALRGGDEPFRTAEAFARRLFESCGEVRGVVRLFARPGRRGGTRAIALGGDDHLDDEIGGTAFRVPAATFLQVNPGAAAKLHDRVTSAAGEIAGKRVLEVYGGVGAFGIALARRGGSVTVVEADAAAVACGREAARRAGLARAVRFRRAEAAQWIAGAERGRYDVLVADPPRSGLGAGVTEGIARIAPRTVVLVSCDPATLARDLARLATLGYAPVRVVPVDLFPQTAHVETVTTLERTADSG